MAHRHHSHLEKFHLNFSSSSFVIHVIISILVPSWFTIMICLVCFLFFLSELVFSGFFPWIKTLILRMTKMAQIPRLKKSSPVQTLIVILVQNHQLIKHTHPVLYTKRNVKLYLRWVIIAKTYTKISNPYVFENFHAEVGAYRAKVVKMIVGDCDSVKSCKTEKKQRLVIAHMIKSIL